MARKVQPKVIKNTGVLHLQNDCTALYIRVSTDKQAKEGYSLDAQKERLLSLCHAKGWTVDEKHIFIDAGISGKSTAGREKFQAMMEAAKSGDINRVVAMKLDRIARNVKDFLGIVDDLKIVNCDMVLVNESFDTSTPHGKFALTMFAAMAELEASTIAERLHYGKAQKATTGGYNGSACPLGYDYDKALKTFTANAQAATVQFIFTRYLAGDSMHTIAHKLNDSGVATKTGGKWAQPTVRYILLNGFYAGLAQWDGVEETGNHPAIIDLDTYHAAVAKIAAAKRGNPNFGK